MFIRPTQIEDLDAAMALYDHARQYMRQNGNDQQWGGGYPSRELVTEDVAKGQSYLCCDDNGTPLAVFCFTVGEEPTYRKIYEGAWLDEGPYGVIHRLGVGAHRGGVCSFCLAWCWQQHPNLRADTHRVNLPMQGCLAKNGFHQCGIIYLADGSERLAYHKTKEK